MHERWVSQNALDAHKAKGVDVWKAFVPCLAAEPNSEELVQVGELLGEGLTSSAIESFVADWYGKLSNRVPVDQLLAMVADIGLDMRFPDVVIRNKQDLTNWYAAVGEQFDQQEHLVESISQLPGENGVTLFVTVIWKARRKSDGGRLAMRANQTWSIGRVEPGASPVILTYAVNSLAEAPTSVAPLSGVPLVASAAAPINA
jgi:hypothetical protein